MKVFMTEENDGFHIELEAETVGDAATLLRFAQNRTKTSPNVVAYIFKPVTTAQGESLPIGATIIAGKRCRGTMFIDGQR